MTSRAFFGFALALVAGCNVIRGQAPELTDVGPRLVSNQTSQPLALVGHDFVTGMVLELGAPFDRRLPVTTVDASHAYTRLPADLAIAPGTEALAVNVAIVGGKKHPVPLRVVNDAAFPDATALAVGRDAVFALSTTTDTIYRIGADHTVTELPAGDGPTAIVRIAHGSDDLLAISHAWEPTIWLCDVGSGVKVRSIAAPAYATNLVSDGDALIVAEHARDTVRRIAIVDGRELWSTPVDPNPKSLAIADHDVAVGSLLTGRVELIDKNSGAPVSTIAPTTETKIVGGHTEPYGKYIMGGKGERALAYAPRAQRLLVASIGPNIGPNPDGMEVSMNGGVGVIDVPGRRFTTHLGFGFGTPEAIVVDENAGVAYVSDIGAGLIRVVDLGGISADDDQAIRAAALWSVPIPLPPSFPLTRPIADFTVDKRSGVELHSGPQALALAPDGATLYVMNRFSGTLALLDVRDVKHKAPAVREQIAAVPTLDQRDRRLGQVLFYTDLGRTGMSCDACHLEGHGDGVLFEKTRPLRIYRNPTIRGTAETPPYFVPASTFSITETVRKVGDRNRFQNPTQSADEVTHLSGFTQQVTTLPNPFVGEDGAPPETLTLLDGKTGRPRVGLSLFDAKCASCHPAPYFTQDQAAATRNHYIDVGTPRLLPLRRDLQNPHFVGFQIPALIGAWDVWPMLNTGSAGYDVDEAHSAVTVRDRFALRAVIERYSGHAHGDARSLSAADTNDLLAYLLTL